MKNLQKLFVLFFLFAAAGYAKAQVYVGPKVGFNVVTVSSPLRKELGISTLSTLDVGFMAEMELGDMFSIQSELMYARKGFSLTQNVDIPLNDNTTIPAGVKVLNNANYIELPVLAKLRFKGKRAETYLLGGASAAYLMSNRVRTQASFIVNITLIDTKIPVDNFTRTDFSVIGGAGLAFKLPVGKFYLDARYRHGLTELVDVPLLTEKVQNRGVNITAGYAIDF